MKKLSMFVAMLLLASASFAQDRFTERDMGDKTPVDFQVQEDGSLIVQGEFFKDATAFQISDKFRYENRKCGSQAKMLERGIKPEMMKSASDCSNSQTVIQSEYDISGTLTIPVVFHILRDRNGAGDVSDALIQSQVDILNEDFGALAGTPGAPGYDTRIRFSLAGITRHDNRQWHNDRRESQYKSSTGWDRDTYLNIWVNKAGGYLGYAYYPDGSAGSNLDGVVLNYTAVGRNAPNGGIYNQGRTATHEIGHYLGLPHTFNGGCSNGYTSGDLIADTNAESTPQYDCVERVTCGSQDPIHNYMDYTPDTCMDNFTAEQANRMVCSIVNYRPLLAY